MCRGNGASPLAGLRMEDNVGEVSAFTYGQMLQFGKVGLQWAIKELTRLLNGGLFFSEHGELMCRVRLFQLLLWDQRREFIHPSRRGTVNWESYALVLWNKITMG